MFWDIPDAAWSDRPTLALAKEGRVYPAAPDAMIVLTCEANDRLAISGDILRVATDVGFGSLPDRIGLHVDGMTVTGEVQWEHGDHEAAGRALLGLAPGQLAKLLSSASLSIVEERSGLADMRSYPTPPRALTEDFLARCSPPAASTPPPGTGGRRTP